MTVGRLRSCRRLRSVANARRHAGTGGTVVCVTHDYTRPARGLRAVADVYWRREVERWGPDGADTLETWRRRVRVHGTPTTIYWVACVRAAVAGLAVFGPACAPGRRPADVLVHVLPAFRERAIGRALLDGVMSHPASVDVSHYISTLLSH